MNELDHFRDEVQTFLAEHLTAELQRAGRLEAGIYAERPVAEAWLQILDQKGWAVPSWPTEWGGTDWSAEQHAIWQQELTLACLLYTSPSPRDLSTSRMPSSA